MLADDAQDLGHQNRQARGGIARCPAFYVFSRSNLGEPLSEASQHRPVAFAVDAQSSDGVTQAFGGVSVCT